MTPSITVSVPPPVDHDPAAERNPMAALAAGEFTEPAPPPVLAEKPPLSADQRALRRLAGADFAL